MINKSLLDILACPVCKSKVEEKEGELVCASCRRHYPILNGIPVMLKEEAGGSQGDSKEK